MLLSYEQQWSLRTIAETPADHIIGIDEVGLGACAGPLVVAGAVFAKHWSHEEVKDSKKFTGGGVRAHEERLKVYESHIRPACVFHATELVHHHEIDGLGMRYALEDAVRRVAVVCSQHVPGAILVVDGDNRPRIRAAVCVLAIPKGDVIVPAVSAASIIAKVTRDAIMIDHGKTYPDYGFERHMGYLTKDHHEVLNRLGPCSIHRLSYKPVFNAHVRHQRSK